MITLAIVMGGSTLVHYGYVSRFWAMVAKRITGNQSKREGMSCTNYLCFSKMTILKIIFKKNTILFILFFFLLYL